MSDIFRSVPISEHVHWVGAVDWNLRDFHGYATGRGTTYNAYLILGDECTLVDTVKAPFRDEMLARISSVADPQQIRYIVSNHSELDHSGCLPEVIDILKPEKVFASAMAVKTLAQHFHWNQNIVAVKEGERLTLGGRRISFLEAKMLHWPESMFSYLEDDQLLFSQDAFGMHLATSERFADEVPREILEYEAAKYYANILLPYSSRISKLLEKVKSSGISFATIAPDHGPVWRKNPEWILSQYAKWSARKPSRKAVVFFDTMWQSTEKMALAVCEGLTEEGIEVKFLPLKVSSRSDVAVEILEAGAILVGSPTLNDQMFPTVADVLTYLKGLRPTNLMGAVFGSYGWSGTAVEEIQKQFAEMKIELAAGSVKVQFVPDDASLLHCKDLGKAVAQKLKEKTV